MRARVMFVSLGLIAASAATSSAEPSAAPPKAVRSGTITGWGATWVAMFNGEARDCQWTEWNNPGNPAGNPECLTWLKSSFDPRLAGRNPAVTASIVDVADLAGATRRRVFTWDAYSYPGWTVGGGVVVQLWRSDCTEITSSKWRSWNGYSRSSRPSTTFRIPHAARWMTVTTNDTANLEWTLR